MFRTLKFGTFPQISVERIQLKPAKDGENDGIAGPVLKKVFRIPSTFSKPQKSRDPNPYPAKSGNKEAKGADPTDFQFLHKKFEHKGYRMFFPKNHERDKEKETQWKDKDNGNIALVNINDPMPVDFLDRMTDH